MLLITNRGEVNEVDKNSLAWMAYSAMCDHYGTPDTTRDYWWTTDLKLAPGWTCVVIAITDEAIRRYKASTEGVEAVPTKPRDILQITRDLSR